MENSPNRKIVEKIVDLINSWNQNEKLIIGLEGPSGIGKTLIVDEIGKKYKNISTLHLDYLMNSSSVRHKAIKEMGDNLKMYETAWYNAKLLKNIISTFRNPEASKIYKFKNLNHLKNKGLKEPKVDLSNNILLIDGVFLLDKKIFDNLFDKIIYLTLDQKIIEQRRKLRFEKNHPNSNYNLALKYRKGFDRAWNDYIKKYKPEVNSSFKLNIKIVDKFS